MFSPVDAAIVGAGSGEVVAGTGVTAGGTVGRSVAEIANDKKRQRRGANFAEEVRVSANKSSSNMP